MCVAVCCSATHCNAVQHTAMHCDTATQCNTMPHSEHLATKKLCYGLPGLMLCNTVQQNATQCTHLLELCYSLSHLTHCNALQHDAVQCNPLHTPFRAVRWPPSSNALQHIATNCNAVQYSATPCTHFFELCYGLSHLTHGNTMQHSATQ